MKTTRKYLRCILSGVLFLFSAYGNPGYCAESQYYGADLSQFPPEVREWIINRAFTIDEMEQDFMVDTKLRVWWSDDNNTVYVEASFIVAEGYVGAGSLETFQGSYSRSPVIFEIYGEFARYHTLKFDWEYRQEVDWLLKNDPVFAEIVELAKLLCAEIEYDWANFSGYSGPVKPTPNLRYAVCAGYANEVTERFLELDSVIAIEEWGTPCHLWNVLILADGRRLYFDLTWFENEYICHETGEIYQTEDYRWKNLTFNAELFRYSGVGYGTGEFTHALGSFVREVRK
jgi:hypothetical protein